MKWNLRLTAARRDIWRATDLHQLLSERGMTISTGKMSNLWSGTPNSVKLDELDIICVVLGCTVEDLLTAEPDLVTPAPRQHTEHPSSSPRNGAQG
ncbi:helix-turn-helix domain-containing protein [Nocardia brasiliensis]